MPRPSRSREDAPACSRPVNLATEQNRTEHFGSRLISTRTSLGQPLWHRARAEPGFQPWVTMARTIRSAVSGRRPSKGHSVDGSAPLQFLCSTSARGLDTNSAARWVQSSPAIHVGVGFTRISAVLWVYLEPPPTNPKAMAFYSKHALTLSTKLI